MNPACIHFVGLTVLTLVAVLVKIDSLGPMLFKQRRIGARAEPFDMLKFRTMGHLEVVLLLMGSAGVKAMSVASGEADFLDTVGVRQDPCTGLRRGGGGCDDGGTGHRRRDDQ